MKRLASILYVMDGDLNGMRTLEQVMTLASEHQATLTLLDVIKSLPPATRMLITSVSTGDLRNSVVQKRLAQLEALVSMIESGSGRLRARVLIFAGTGTILAGNLIDRFSA